LETPLWRRIDPLIAIFVAVQLIAGGVAAWPFRFRDGPVEEPDFWGIAANYFRVFTPTLTAILLLGWSGGADALRGLARRLLRWRVSGWLYLAAVAVPLVALLVGAIAEGQRPAWKVDDMRPHFGAILLLMMALNIVVSWLAIEPGMRGFLQERANATRHPLLWAVGIGLLGSCALGFPFMPHFYSWEYIGRQLVVYAGLAVIAGWLYLRSGGSLVLSGLAFASVGVASMARVFLFHGEASSLAGDVLDGGLVVVALLLLLHENAPVLRRWVMAGTPQGAALRRTEAEERVEANGADVSR